MASEPQIERDSVAVLKAIAEYADPSISPSKDSNQRRYILEPDDLAVATDLPWERIKDALELLDTTGYVELIVTFGGIQGATLTPVGRYEYQRLNLQGVAQETERATPPTGQRLTLPPQPIGSPYRFTDEDWETVSDRKARGDTLFVALGYQFISDHYDSDILKGSIENMFLSTVNEYTKLPEALPIKLNFRPLEAGYGEHVFNEIARDIISSDITVFETSDLNPNVMLEMGVALTWDVRVLPIKEENRPPPPSDISGQTWANYRDSARTFVDPGHAGKLLRMVERAARKKRRP